MAMSKISRTRQIRGNDLARFWSKVQKTGGCWLWVGGKQSNGYGIFYVGKKNVGAHRYSFHLAYGKWPFPVARHTCDNPSCVRPEHLVAGSQADNVRDREERGRTARRQGEDHSQVKLSEADVLAIRKLLSSGEVGLVVAKQYGVSASHISSIRKGKAWRHLDLSEMETPHAKWTCGHCKKVFVKSPRYGTGMRKFCSMKCHYDAARSATPRWRCQQCGEIFAKALRDGHGVRKFCGRACHHAYGRECVTYERINDK